jgi:hypothetical protein
VFELRSTGVVGPIVHRGHPDIVLGVLDETRRAKLKRMVSVPFNSIEDRLHRARSISRDVSKQEPSLVKPSSHHSRPQSRDTTSGSIRGATGLRPAPEFLSPLSAEAYIQLSLLRIASNDRERFLYASAL